MLFCNYNKGENSETDALLIVIFHTIFLCSGFNFSGEYAGQLFTIDIPVKLKLHLTCCTAVWYIIIYILQI